MSTKHSGVCILDTDHRGACWTQDDAVATQATKPGCGNSECLHGAGHINPCSNVIRSLASPPEAIESAARAVYMKSVPKANAVDVYRVQLAFGVTDPCLQHALKKILCPGQRKAGKTMRQDIEEAIYSLQRWCEMRDEEGSSK